MIYTIGFELTALVPGYEEYIPRPGYASRPTETTDRRTKATADRVIRKLRKGRKGWSPGEGTDGHCIEISSPVCEHKQEALDFYSEAWEILKWHEGCTPKNPITVCGGGHLHFALDDELNIAHCLRELARNYFIPWVFTQPDDTDSCDNVIQHGWLNDNNPENYITTPSREYFRGLYKCSGEAPRGSVIWGSKSMAGTLNAPIGSGVLTLEYRCVEAPLDVFEFEKQLEFFMRFTDYALDRVSPPLWARDPQWLNAIPAKQAVEQFKTLLKALKLPFKDYEAMVKRNLLPRWTQRRLRV